ncbi:hypothetical protein [Clostridium sp. D53t1_180928_C8]|uniref:hypothetical protein n=1 Tax=Clostridium sp. D53t1_180928_C8 TaxID=2787101 RepID=UPI0018A8C997|nr:hypothetical protein [Clostridium sp. D53t1_180928_C8]
MNSVYRLMLNNKAFDDIVENLINNKKVAIIKQGNDLEELIIYFKEFIINKFDKDSLNIEIDKIISDTNYKNLEVKKMIVLRRQIVNNAENIIKIFSGFIDKDSIKYSLNDLYSITQKNIEFKDKEFEYYSLLSKAPVISENDSLTIIKKVKELIKNNCVNTFIRYKKFNSNKRFDVLRDDIQENCIDDIIKKLSGVLNNTFAFIPPIYFNDYTSDFQEDKVYYKNYSNDQIKEIAKNVNYKHNKNILDDIERLKWYKYIGIKRYKEMINEKKKRYEEYNEKEELIYNQYIENIENLKLFSNSFSFVKKVFKNEVLDKINNCIINEEELYNYILYIKETLSIYKDYLTLEKKVKRLDEELIKILEYIYEKIDDKRELINILEFIENYYFYKQIEYVENERADTINSYNKVYEKINKLNESLKSYNKILIQALRESCIKGIKGFCERKNIKLDSVNVDKLCDNRYNEENGELLLNIFPILILDEDQYKQCKDKIDEKFDLIVSQSELNNQIEEKNVKENKKCNERLDRNIFKMLNNLGYTIFREDDDISVIYVNFNKEKNKIIYINNKEFFDYEELIKIIDLINSEDKIIFVWYRNWWLSKNDEVEKIHKLINE